MPSKSKQQQKFFGVVKAMQKGDIPKKGEAGEVADDMTKKEVDKMASTKHKGLVNKIKELVEEEIKALIEAKLPDEGFSDPEQMREAKSAKSLKSDYDKAVKKEQALSSLLLVNLEKYKSAKASGDEKAIAKHTKIAADLSKKKSKATTDASAAYKAYEDKISGLHADAELELKEVEANDDTEFTITLKHLLDKHVAKGGEVNEALPNFKTPFEAYDWIMNKRSEAMDNEMEMRQKTKDIIQTQKDMEQEASPEGGPTTDRYGAVLEKLQMEHEALRKEFSSIMAEIDEYDQN